MTLRTALFAALATLVPWGAAGAEGFRILYEATAHDAVYAVAAEGDRALGVGAAGLAVISDDGGRTWTRRPTPVGTALLGVALAGDRALAVGQSGTILRGDGRTWTAVPSGTEGRLFAVALAGDGTAVAAGGFGVLLRSEDGGATWRNAAPDWAAILEDAVEPHLYAVRMVGGAVFVAGEFGLVLRSTDGGRTWSATRTGDASLFDLAVDGKGRGLAVGQKGTVVRTTDGGATWQHGALDTDSAVLGVWLSGERAQAVGIQCAFRSTDGGVTWTPDGRGDVATAWYQSIAGDGRPIVAGHSGRIAALGE